MNNERQDNPLHGLDPSEVEACALRYSDAMSYRRIGQRLGVNHMKAKRLVKRGTAKILANGYPAAFTSRVA